MAKNKDSKKSAAKNVVTVSPRKRHDLSYTQNRELSWLRFDGRVLDEAFDETVPLFERLKFVSIFESNLVEFFMVRIGGLSDLATLKRQPVDNKSNMTPAEQIECVFNALPPMIDRAVDAQHRIEAALESYGIVAMSSKRAKDGLVEWLGRENLSKGVQIRNVGDMLDVDLFIIVEYGISIAEVCKTIADTVRYKLESMTGVKVRKVNISVEGIRV